MTDDERRTLIATYLDDHRARGGIVDDEAQRQAAAYADRIAANRQYEADRAAAQQQQAARAAAAAPAAAARSHYTAVAKANAEARAGWNVAPDLAYGKVVADNARRHEDGDLARTTREASAARIAGHQAERSTRVAALLDKLRKTAGGDPAALQHLARAATTAALRHADDCRAVELSIYQQRLRDAARREGEPVLLARSAARIR